MSLTSPQLPGVGLIAELSKEDRDILSSYGNFHLAQKGETVITQGASHGKLFFIISGLLHARCDDNGHDVLLGTIKAGEWIGEIDLFDLGAAMCSVVAMDSSQYWVITRKDIEDFIQNYPPAGIRILIGISAMLGRRLRAITRKLTEQTEFASIRNALFQG